MINIEKPKEFSNTISNSIAVSLKCLKYEIIIFCNDSILNNEHLFIFIKKSSYKKGIYNKFIR